MRPSQKGNSRPNSPKVKGRVLRKFKFKLAAGKELEDCFQSKSAMFDANLEQKIECYKCQQQLKSVKQEQIRTVPSRLSRIKSTLDQLQNRRTQDVIEVISGWSVSNQQKTNLGTQIESQNSLNISTRKRSFFFGNRDYNQENTSIPISLLNQGKQNIRCSIFAIKQNTTPPNVTSTNPSRTLSLSTSTLSYPRFRSQSRESRFHQSKPGHHQYIRRAQYQVTNIMRRGNLSCLQKVNELVDVRIRASDFLSCKESIGINNNIKNKVLELYQDLNKYK